MRVRGLGVMAHVHGDHADQLTELGGREAGGVPMRAERVDKIGGHAPGLPRSERVERSRYGLQRRVGVEEYLADGHARLEGVPL